MPGVLIFLQEYFEFQGEYRSGVVGSLVRKYHGIGPLLIKVEGLVVFTNTGRSFRLEKYYAYWEKRLFNSFVKVRLWSAITEDYTCFSIVLNYITSCNISVFGKRALMLTLLCFNVL